MIRRESPAAPRPALALVPTFKGFDVPPFAPAAPVAGWTPSSAWAAALNYGDAHEDAHTTARLLSSAAYRALLGAVPGLHRADVVARLQGVDVRAGIAAEAAPLLQRPPQSVQARQ